MDKPTQEDPHTTFLRSSPMHLLSGAPMHFLSGVDRLPMIGKLLGHTQVQTTARYAHLAADPLEAAADQVASNISALLNEAA